MPEHYPDISSSGQANIRVADLPGRILCFRVASFHPDRVSGKVAGGVLDPNAPRFYREALDTGKLPIPYLYIGGGVPAREQVHRVLDHLGVRGLSWMPDHETGSGSFTHLRAFFAEFRAAGEHPGLLYLPRWHWTGALGRPPLGGLAPLVNSDYRAGPTGSGGWADFIAADGTSWPVRVLQYTDREQHAGHAVDMNHFPGSFNEFRAMVSPPPPLPPPSGPGSGAYAFRLPATGVS